MTPENTEEKKSKPQQDKFDWADEGLSALVRVIILSWSAAILTLNYVTVPGIPQKNIDPTFIASVFTGTLATFGVQAAKKDNGNTQSPPPSPAQKDLPPAQPQRRKDLRDEE